MSEARRRTAVFRDLAAPAMFFCALVLAAACGHTRPWSRRAAGPVVFETPQGAGAALGDACPANTRHRPGAGFGETGPAPAVSGGSGRDDQPGDGDQCEGFVRAATTMTRLDPWGDHRLVVVVGADDFAFPVPLVERGAGWQFDPEAGAAEVLRRRAGENEINAIAACRSW